MSRHVTSRHVMSRYVTLRYVTLHTLHIRHRALGTLRRVRMLLGGLEGVGRFLGLTPPARRASPHTRLIHHPSWDHVGFILGHLGPFLGHLGLSWPSSGPPGLIIIHLDLYDPKMAPRWP